MGTLEEKLWILTQNDDYISYQVVEPEQKVKSEHQQSQLQQYESILKTYFQWDVELETLYSQWSKADANFKKVASDYQGVRMLRQDPVENLFSFICSSNNNIQRLVIFI
jgi:N-glycosylase/DNA lyase